MPPFSRLRTCVLAAAFSLTAAGALTAAPQQHAPDAHMSVSLYQGKALSFNEQIGAVFVAQPSIASYQVVGNRKVVVFGSYPGKTSLMVLGTDGRTLYNGLVEVAYDVSSMEMALKSSFPKLKLQLVALNDGVAVRGKVETAQEAANVVAFLDAMLQVNPQQAQMAAADVSAAGQEGQQEKSGAATGTGTLGARIGKIINQLTVTTPNQVTVRVRFAEVNRKLSDQLGFKWKGSYSGSRGGITFGSADNPIISNPNNSLGHLFDPATMAARFTFGSLFDAMASEELVSILAEPNLTVVSGETASFLAGGQIPFQSSDGDGGFDIEFKDYGVLLSITPTILSGNRISLRLRPEVSERSDSNGIQFMGSTQPGFIVRRAESTIELASGQSFAIAGLLKNDFSNTGHLHAPKPLNAVKPSSSLSLPRTSARRAESPTPFPMKRCMCPLSLSATSWMPTLKCRAVRRSKQRVSRRLFRKSTDSTVRRLLSRSHPPQLHRGKLRPRIW